MSSHFPREHLTRGILFMLLGSILFSVADALGKLVTQSYPLGEVVWLRCVFGMAVIAVFILAKDKGKGFRTSRYKAQFGRSLAGITLTGCMMTGLKYIPLAEVTALAFATPLIVAIYSAMVLREPVSKGMFAAVTLGLVGVLVVVRPTPDHFHFAHLVMLGFALSSAYLSITARALAQTESALTLNFYIYPAAVVFYAGFAFSDWVTPDLVSLLALFGVALFATLALLCLTRAVHYASPARVVPFDYSRIIWNVNIGWLFWGELPDALTWLGIAIIILCGLWIVRHGRRAAASPDNA